MPRRDFSTYAAIGEEFKTDHERNSSKGSRRGETDSNGNQVPKRRNVGDARVEPARDAKTIAYKYRGHNRR